MTKKTIRIYKPDKEFIDELVDRQDVTAADVVADLIEACTDLDHDYRCPVCKRRFTLGEVDTESIQEYGVFATELRELVRGRRVVKDFACPRCGSQIQPDDLHIVDLVENNTDSSNH